MNQTVVARTLAALSLLAALACGAKPAMSQNTVLVADSGNNRVLSYNINATNDWSLNGVFADANDGSSLVAPGPIVYDGSGNVYIGETTGGSARILKYNTGGQFQSVVTTFQGEIPDDMIIAPDGNLLVSNPFGSGFFGHDDIYKVDVGSGSINQFIAQPDPAFPPPGDYLLDNPRGMAIAGNTLYVANRNGMGTSGGSILRFNANTGAYLDAGIGADPDPAVIDDDVYADFDNPQALHYDSATNELIASVFGGGQDLYTISLDSGVTGPPPLSPATAAGVTKIYDPNDTGGILGIDVVKGVTYWSSYDGAVYRLDAVDTKTQVVSGLGHGLGIEEIPFQGIGGVELEWLVDGLGDWTTASNWFGGEPNGNTAKALLGGTITADSTVYLNGADTLKSLRIDNANSYVVAGGGSLTFDADTGNASIEVDSGSHELQLPINLADNTDITVAAGATLAFNNELNLNGKTLTITGAGTVDFNNAVVKGGGSISVLPSAILLGGETLGNLLTAAVPEPTSCVLLLTGSLLCGFSRRRNARA